MTDIADQRGIKSVNWTPHFKNISRPTYTMSSRQHTLSRTDRQSFQAFRHPAFVQAVNRAANLKCMEAIKSGKLRVVAPHPSSTPSEYIPRMDLIDNPAETILTAIFEIPGLKTSDISLHILEGHLVVLGERQVPYNITQQSEGLSQDAEGNGSQAPKLTTIPIQELRFGTFRRAVLVPEGLKESEVKASLNEGMLTVTWPRIPGAAVRTRRPHSSSPPTSSAAVQ